jgi:hypothetical protein
MNRHWTGIQRIFRYLQHTKHLALRYGDGAERPLYGYSDTEFASDTQDRRSTMGYVYRLLGASVTWAVRKQQSVSTLSTEAEYVGLCNAAKEAVWIRSLLQHIGRSVYTENSQATFIYGDNQGALRLVANPEFHARSKHIDVQYYYTRELLENGTIRIEYIRTSEMAADCLTKPLKGIQ